ncbi:cysteine protease rd19c-related [Anaeramoeba ignava]|uniref:Cysteine protease rd19c-related n=1 Tax=Anaeramoeba ignava TaxID=1746090 RepID=A0A9Q0LDU2_ANAIG|nr:cysteine protease rd19c-related [Anaeramoeba ignava]
MFLLKSNQIFFFFCFFLLVSSIQIEQQKIQFENWMNKYKKFYSSEKEKETRFQIFQENLLRIENLRQSDPSAKYDINMFADLTPEEFKKTHLLSKKFPELKSQDKISEELSLKDIPSSFDWRTQGKVTAVKDQGDCGSCWAFSAIQQIESAWAIAGNPLTNLSVEQAVECSGGCDPTTQVCQACGCFGGFPWFVYSDSMTWGGISTETNYPYCIPPFGGCYPCLVNTTGKTICPAPEYCNRTCNTHAPLTAHISNWSFTPEDEDQMAAYLVSEGPLSACIDSEWMEFYFGGIANPLFCGSSVDDIDHCILVVGYGEDGSKKFWILKNSWGKSWGENGYARLIRGKKKCCIDLRVTYTTI